MEDERDPYEIADRRILTFVEHKLLGSTVDREDMIKNPYTPQAILDGEDPREVFDARLKQREFISMQSGYFGLKTGEMPVVALNVLDQLSGRVSADINLVGVRDFYSQKINRDPEMLKQHRLSDEGRSALDVEGHNKPGGESEVA